MFSMCFLYVHTHTHTHTHIHTRAPARAWIVNSHFSTLIIASEPLANFTRYKERAPRKKRIRVKRISPSMLRSHTHTYTVSRPRYISFHFLLLLSYIFFRKVNVLIARFLWPFLACRLLGKVYSGRSPTCVRWPLSEIRDCRQTRWGHLIVSVPKFYDSFQGYTQP